MRVIKKYSNRRLYDTSSSTYVNLDNLADIIRGGELVQIIDARSGADLTRAILMQVILEAQGALDLLPVGLLHRMIRLGGASPVNAIYRKQLATGLEMLDAQITRMEQQFQLIRPDTPPPPRAATQPEPPPPDDDEDEDEAPPPPEQPAPAGEMDALRARLAALEARLTRTASDD